MSRCALVVFVVANRWGPVLMTADDQDKIRSVVVGTDRAHQPHHRNGITSHPDPETERYRAKEDLVVAFVTHASTVQSFSLSYYPNSTFPAYPHHQAHFRLLEAQNSRQPPTQHHQACAPITTSLALTCQIHPANSSCPRTPAL